jgi:DNA polymerase III epsilon subunit family exonuclease
MINPNRKISEMSFCAVDLETTGISAALHMIVEVGMVRFNVRGVEEEYERLVNPGFKIPSDVIDVHGITDEMVKDAPSMNDLMADVARIISDTVLVIHNPGFDLGFLGWAFQRSERQAPSMEAVDTIRLARRAWPDLRNYKLDTLSEFLGLNIQHHRALPDARACMEIFTRMIRQEDPEGNWTIADLINYHGNLIPFIKVRGRRIIGSGKRLMGLQLGAKANITYVDNSGAITVRTIHPREFITIGGQSYVLAHCSLRGDTRYFKMDRIIEIV